MRQTRLPVAVPTDVHLREGADVADADDVDGEVTVEVDDLERAMTDAEADEERRDERTHHLLQQVELRTMTEVTTTKTDTSHLLPAIGFYSSSF